MTNDGTNFNNISKPKTDSLDDVRTTIRKEEQNIRTITSGVEELKKQFNRLSSDEKKLIRSISPTLWNYFLEKGDIVFSLDNQIWKQFYQSSRLDIFKYTTVNEDDIKTLYNESYILYNKGELEKALQKTNQALSIDPYNIDLLSLKGLIYEKLGKLQDAFLQYDRITDIDDKNYSAYFYKGYCLDKLENHASAVESYNKAIEIIESDDFKGDPKWLADLYYNKGIALKSMGNTRDALESFEKTSLLEDGKRWDTLDYLGRLYHEIREYDKAIEAFEKVLKKKGNNPNTINSIGIEYLGKREYDKAIEYFKKAIDINDKFIEAVYNLGLSFEAKGTESYSNKKYDECKRFLQEAYTWYNNALKLQSNYQKATEGLIAVENLLKTIKTE